MSSHAETEREADTLPVSEIEEALLSPLAEVLEDYPDDPRGHSALILGFTTAQLPVHVVVGLSLPGTIILITVYRPDPARWYDWRKRRS
jgi:Domain of unknown function (DUF4258)